MLTEKKYNIKEIFVMAIFDKLGDIARNIGDKTTDAIETTKLNSKINSEKAAIVDCMRKIGEIYYQNYSTGAPVDSAASELFKTIDEHNKAIVDMQAEIDRIKAADNAGQEQATATTVPASGEITCVNCGNTNPSGTNFCSGCGSKLETPAPAPETENLICPECGGPVPNASNFCGGCGYKFQ